jgi:hypothetical protein
MGRLMLRNSLCKMDVLAASAMTVVDELVPVEEGAIGLEVTGCSGGSVFVLFVSWPEPKLDPGGLENSCSGFVSEGLHKN